MSEDIESQDSSVTEKSKPAKVAKSGKSSKSANEAVEKSAKSSKSKAAKPEGKTTAAKQSEPTAVAPARPAVQIKTTALGDFPVPPPPVRAPFVPPKTTAPKALEEMVATADGSVPQNAGHGEAFVQKQRQRLLDLRDELVDAMSGMTRDTIRNAPEGSEASGSGQHTGDAGSDAYDRDFALSVLAKEQDALYEIEQALRRIQVGNYGICEISAKKIPQARLEAIPFARLTVECQAQWEKEYGKRRFRPSNEVGFSGGKYVEDEDSDTVSLDDEEE